MTAAPAERVGHGGERLLEGVDDAAEIAKVVAEGGVGQRLEVTLGHGSGGDTELCEDHDERISN
jgi:hypothetical protein